MNDVNLAPENKEATPEHGYLMAYDKKEQKAKGVKGIAANGELETLEANEANQGPVYQSGPTWKLLHQLREEFSLPVQ